MFAKYLKDPKFIELFEQYATSLKDPKVTSAAMQHASHHNSLNQCRTVSCSTIVSEHNVIQEYQFVSNGCSLCADSS